MNAELQKIVIIHFDLCAISILIYLLTQSFAMYGPMNYLLIAWHSAPCRSVTHYSAPCGPKNHCQYHAVDPSYWPLTILLNRQIFIYLFFHISTDLTCLHTCVSYYYNHYYSFHCSMSINHCRISEKNFSVNCCIMWSLMTDVDSVKSWPILTLLDSSHSAFLLVRQLSRVSCSGSCYIFMHMFV